MTRDELHSCKFSDSRLFKISYTQCTTTFYEFYHFLVFVICHKHFQCIFFAEKQYGKVVCQLRGQSCVQLQIMARSVHLYLLSPDRALRCLWLLTHINQNSVPTLEWRSSPRIHSPTAPVAPTKTALRFNGGISESPAPPSTAAILDQGNTATPTI